MKLPNNALKPSAESLSLAPFVEDGVRDDLSSETTQPKLIAHAKAADLKREQVNLDQQNNKTSYRVVIVLLVLLSIALAGFYVYLQLKSVAVTPIYSASNVVSLVSPAKPALAEGRETKGQETPSDNAKEETLKGQQNGEQEATKSQTVKYLLKEAAIENAQWLIASTAETTKDKPSKPLNAEMEVSQKSNLAKTTASVQTIKNEAGAQVNPSLVKAYLAFNAGDAVSAQNSYREVLKNDARNTDALLGMAAVALKQGRNDDAAGWYQNVLEVDPKNSFAQSAMTGLSPQSESGFSETSLKNLIASKPDSANLYAALGNLYVEQKQWPSAQEAYFKAHQLDAKSADYAFNLAVSLEQIGKPKLAMPFYKRALELSAASPNNISHDALEKRMLQLEARGF